MSLIGLNTNPAERMRGCKFAENFFNTAKVAENGGIAGGSPTINQGVTLDGSTQYVSYALAGTEFNSANISIVMEFYPDFNPSSGVLRYLFDTTAASRFTAYVHPIGTMYVFFGPSGVVAVPQSNYEPYWIENGKNVLVMAGTSGSEKIYLNGELVFSASVAWAAVAPTTLFVGCANSLAAKFIGRITKFQVYHSLLTEQEAIDLYENDTYDYRDNLTLDLPCDDRFDNPTIKKAEDSTFNENDATLGDGVTASLMPAKLSGRRGYTFDGVDDYISGITAPTGSFTVSVMKRVSGTVSITQENDLTTWNQLFSSGGFTGELLTLRVHPSVLTETQKLDEQFLLNERLNVHGLPSGIISSLVSEGACVLYQDYRSGYFRDWSENGNGASPDAAVTWNTRSLSFGAVNARLTVSDALELRPTEGSIVVFANFAAPLGTQYIITKKDAGGSMWSLYTTSGPATLNFDDGTNIRTLAYDPDGTNYLGLNFANGEKCEAFGEAISSGLFNDVSAITADDADITIGANYLGGNRFYQSPTKAVLLFNRKLTETEHRRLYSELYADSWATEVVSRYVADVVEYVEPDDPTLRLALDVKSSAGVCNDLSGYGNHGTPSAGVMNRITSFGVGADGSGLSGTGINCGYSDSLRITGGLTLAGWIEVRNIPALIYVILRSRYGLYISSTEELGFYTRKADDSGNDVSAIAPAPCKLGVWHHFAAVYDPVAGQKILYLDGIAGTPIAKTDGGIAGVSSQPMLIASSGGNNANVTMILPQVFAEAKSAAWVQAEYAKGLGALSQTNGAAQESIANETSGYLSNTPFEITSGTWKVSEDTIDETPVKVLECVAAGSVSVALSNLYQNQVESARGTWEWYMYKGSDTSIPHFMLVASASAIPTAGTQNGYYLRFGSGERLEIVKVTAGAANNLYLTDPSFVNINQWYKLRVTRTSGNVMRAYIDDVEVPSPAPVGSYPVTDSSHTTATHIVIDFDAFDKIAFSDKSGNYAITKKLLAEE
jgi:hypothetical protein